MFSSAKRLLLLMIVGLGSLYVMHLLAQDFMKLSKPLFMASGKRDISSFNRTAELNVSWLIAVLTCAIIFCFEFYVRISEIAYSNIYYPIYIITVIIAFQRISELWKTYWLEWYAQTRSTEMLVITYLPTGRRRWAEKRSCKCNLRIYSVRAFSK